MAEKLSAKGVAEVIAGTVEIVASAVSGQGQLALVSPDKVEALINKVYDALSKKALGS